MVNERSSQMKFTDCKTKAQRVAHLKVRLATNPNWATEGLLRIYERQTTDEQEGRTTSHHNKVGFSGAHAEIMSSYAEQIREGKTMSSNQMRVIHRIMPKYARQLETISA